MKKIIFFIGLILGMVSVHAQKTDSIRFSLLTCEPGSEIYALFGHSAIRYENPAKDQDWVFNYGMFSFRDPNFVWRFVKGETDYQLGVVPFNYFEAEYALRGSSVHQQVLNLSSEEKLRLLKLLETNYLPQNRVYRYNYFYDNCTTRARDKVEESIAGKVVYPENKKDISFRDILHEFTDGSEWSEFGIDLCLGSEADKPINLRKQMFAPFYLLDAAREAQIARGDSLVPFIREEFKVVDVEPEEFEAGFPLSPMTCALIWLLISCSIVWVSIQKGKIYWAWDAFLFGIQGLGGCVIAFLFFFSLHPTVGSNWMILMFNPIPLFYLPIMIYKGIKGKKDLYHAYNAAVLTIFICSIPFLPQKINPTVLPLALNLLITSAGHLYIYYKRHL